MSKPTYTPPLEAWAYLPPDYYDLPVEQRARALQKAGSAMGEDVFRQMLGADFDRKLNSKRNS